MLERQEEYLLAKRWCEHGDRDAANQLVTSHLRLVIKIARDYHRYGSRPRGLSFPKIPSARVAAT